MRTSLSNAAGIAAATLRASRCGPHVRLAMMGLRLARTLPPVLAALLAILGHLAPRAVPALSAAAAGVVRVDTLKRALRPSRHLSATATEMAVLAAA